MANDPFIQTNPIVAGIEQHRARIEQVKENSARLAQSYATFTTTGDGDHTIPDPSMFGCTFTEQPVIAYGYSMDGDQLADDTAPLPRCNGFVRKWVQDARGHYIGAYVCFVVDTSRVEPQAPDPEPTEDTNATPPATAPSRTFTDLFDRADSALVGNGWTQTGGDWGISNKRASTPDDTSYLCRPFGHVSQTVQADLRSPNSGQPCVFAWSNSTAGAQLGYALAFSASAQGTNLVLYRSGDQVAAKHFGAANAAIGNVTKRIKLEVVETGTTVAVKGYVDGSLQLTFNDTTANAPTGSYSGFGNNGTGDVSCSATVLGEVMVTTGPTPTATPTAPEEAEEAEEVPVYVIDHDFTFTGIALKDLPDYLLDDGRI